MVRLEERVEVGRVETAYAQLRHGRIGELGESMENGFPRCGIVDHIEIEASALGAEKAGNGPVLGALLGEPDAAVLQLCQRLKVARAFVDRAELMTAHTRQIQDRYRPLGPVRLRKRAIASMHLSQIAGPVRSPGV